MSQGSEPGSEFPELDPQLAQELAGIFDDALAEESAKGAATEDAGTLMCVIWTPFASAEVLAGICALQKLAVHVIPGSRGSLIALEIPVSAEVDFELLTQSFPASAEAIAKEISGAAGAEVVLLSARLKHGDEGVAGDITAYSFENGERGNKVSPGLILARADDVLVELLTGTRGIDQVPSAIDVASLSMRKAAAYIRRGIKKNRG